MDTKTEEAIAQRKATVAQTLEKVKAEAESLKQTTTTNKPVDANATKWKEMLEFKEKEFEDEISELNKKLKVIFFYIFFIFIMFEGKRKSLD